MEYNNVLIYLQDQVATMLDDCSGRFQITFTANSLYSLYFHPRCQLILGKQSLSVTIPCF